jgi:hypothetical protein
LARIVVSVYTYRNKFSGGFNVRTGGESTGAGPDLAGRRSVLIARGDSAQRRETIGLPDPRTRHLVSRFTSGVSAIRVAQVAAAGGVDAWFEGQLSPGDIPDHGADVVWTWFPTLALTPLQRWEAYQAGTESNTAMMQDLASWTMLRRLLSSHAVEEMMVDFWSNLMHVASPFERAWVHRVDYQQMIRRHALGSFDAILHETIQHPAMGLFLNNVDSTAAAINENLGRELLECFTVGVGQYDEKDVLNSVRILTGFHVDVSGTWAASYIPGNHWVGRVKVLGFTSPNAKPNGLPVLDKYLSYLARLPLTAQRLCARLAVRFVRDFPSQELVDSLAQVYLDSDTEIVPVLRALVASDEFQTSTMAKVRTPVEDTIATWAALGVAVAPPHQELDAANQIVKVSQTIGQVPYDWDTPDAFPDRGAAWLGTGRILASLRTHWMAASQSWPSQGITFKSAMDWMPQLPTTFDHVVTHVVRQVLFLPCTPEMLAAACLATDLKPYDVIDETNTLITYNFPRLMVSILDTVEHLSR